jgi:Domain of unknown function (DUF6908)
MGFFFEEPSMKTVAKIIELHGGLDSLRQKSIRVHNPPYMRLVIEHIGEGPRGMPAISVAHYYEQNGDLMRDPEMVFEVNQAGEWEPVSYQQDNLNIHQEAVAVEDGRVVLHHKLIQDLKAFARQWDRNIAAQGFLKAGGGQ